eukprot:scaffold287_cov337-Pavlova_lutheri.AAC.43
MARSAILSEDFHSFARPVGGGVRERDSVSWHPETCSARCERPSLHRWKEAGAIQRDLPSRFFDP